MTQPATLYSTWMQRSAKPVYFVVWNLWLKEGRVIKYTLLRMFEPEFSDIDPAKFQELVDKNVLVEWKL